MFLPYFFDGGTSGGGRLNGLEQYKFQFLGYGYSFIRSFSSKFQFGHQQGWFDWRIPCISCSSLLSNTLPPDAGRRIACCHPFCPEWPLDSRRFKWPVCKWSVQLCDIIFAYISSDHVTRAPVFSILYIEMVSQTMLCLLHWCMFCLPHLITASFLYVFLFACYIYSMCVCVFFSVFCLPCDACVAWKRYFSLLMCIISYIKVHMPREIDIGTLKNRRNDQGFLVQVTLPPERKINTSWGRLNFVSMISQGVMASMSDSNGLVTEMFKSLVLQCAVVIQESLISDGRYTPGHMKQIRAKVGFVGSPLFKVYLRWIITEPVDNKRF